MPHQCVKCGTFFPDTSDVILKGCKKCKGKFFFYIKQERMNEIKTKNIKLKPKDISKIEKDVRSLMPDNKKDKPIVLDFETIRVISPGKYEIDIVNLMSGKPLVIQVGDGKYFIDLSTLMKKK